jgi:uncharacterized SAM-binding protein YcdF (DUF218 family)
MKEKIIAFVHGLISYDYILVGGVLFLFLLFLILAIILRNRTGLSIFLILLSFAILFLGPTLGYVEMRKYLFKNEVAMDSQQRLTFTPAIVVRGSLKNESQLDFKSCVITASALKASSSALKNFVYSLKPLKSKSIVELGLAKGDTRIFKIIVEPFTYQNDYNISLKASCE